MMCSLMRKPGEHFARQCMEDILPRRVISDVYGNRNIIDCSFSVDSNQYIMSHFPGIGYVPNNVLLIFWIESIPLEIQLLDATE